MARKGRRCAKCGGETHIEKGQGGRPSRRVCLDCAHVEEIENGDQIRMQLICRRCGRRTRHRGKMVDGKSVFTCCQCWQSWSPETHGDQPAEDGSREA